jgi:hypothetical protein
MSFKVALNGMVADLEPAFSLGEKQNKVCLLLKAEWASIRGWGQAWWYMPLIPAIRKVEIRRIMVQSFISTNNPDMVVNFCNPSYTRGIHSWIPILPRAKV